MIVCQPGAEPESDTGAPPIVEATAAGYAFAAPDTIPAGWVTFRMANRGEESHHYHLDRFPEGRTVAEWREAVKETADSILQLVAEGKIGPAKAGAATDRVTPDWAGPATWAMFKRTEGWSSWLRGTRGKPPTTSIRAPM